MEDIQKNFTPEQLEGFQKQFGEMGKNKDNQSTENKPVDDEEEIPDR